MEKTDMDRYKERQKIFIEMIRAQFGNDIIIDERPILSDQDDWEMIIRKIVNRKKCKITLSSELMTDDNNNYLSVFKSEIITIEKTFEE